MALNLNDHSGNSNTLTNNGADEVTINLPFVESLEAVDFELSNSDYLSASDSASLSLTSDFTIEFWLKLEQLPSTAGTDMWILSKSNVDTIPNGWEIYILSNNLLKVEWQDSSSNRSVFVVTNPLDSSDVDNWVHWAFVVDISGPSATIYKNGNSIAVTNSLTNATTINDNTADLNIGRRQRSVPVSYLDGKLDEIRIWSDIRTSEEITANKNRHLDTNTETNLAAYWPFEVIASPSPSMSPSSSLSPSSSYSPSASNSPSPSTSPSSSVSSSSSPSSSESPSSSFSPSPSVGYSGYSRGTITPEGRYLIGGLNGLRWVFGQHIRLGGEKGLAVDDSDLDHIYTNQEESNVEVIDNSWVGQEGALVYMVHQFKSFVGDHTYCTLEWVGKSTLPPSLSIVYLQVYNKITGLWENFDSNNTSDEDLDFELEARIPDTSNYKGQNSTISCRVYQLAI